MGILKWSLRIYGIIAVIYGLVFLLFPGGYIAFSGADPVAFGWLRWPGGTLLGLGVGTVLLSRDPSRQSLFVTTVAMVASLIGLALLYTLIAGEYTLRVQSLVIPIVLNLTAAGMLWWSRSRNKEALSGR